MDMITGSAERVGMRSARRNAWKAGMLAAAGLGALVLASCGRDGNGTAFGLERRTETVVRLQQEQDCIRQVDKARGMYAFCPGSWPANQEMEERIYGMGALRRGELYKEDEARINAGLGQIRIYLRKANEGELERELRTIKKEDYGEGRAMAIGDLKGEIYGRRSVLVRLADGLFSDRNLRTVEVLMGMLVLLIMLSKRR